MNQIVIIRKPTKFKTIYNDNRFHSRVHRTIALSCLVAKVQKYQRQTIGVFSCKKLSKLHLKVCNCNPLNCFNFETIKTTRFVFVADGLSVDFLNVSLMA